MAEREKTWRRKLELLRKGFGHTDSFTISEAESVLGEKMSTLYWTFWNLSRNGYLRKIGKGLYTFQEKAQDIRPVPSPLGTRIAHTLEENGYRFFISGLDILSVFMDHIPESYPIILYADKYSINEIRDLLARDRIIAASQRSMEGLKLVERTGSIEGIVLLYPTNEFSYAQGGFASFEKAFVDLYYEVTRRRYPLSLQELARIFSNMKRRIDLDSGRLIKIGSRRSIQADIRYIVEKDLISERAIEFADALGKQ
jgi:hypothetical protein